MILSHNRKWMQLGRRKCCSMELGRILFLTFFTNNWTSSSTQETSLWQTLPSRQSKTECLRTKNSLAINSQWLTCVTSSHFLKKIKHISHFLPQNFCIAKIYVTLTIKTYFQSWQDSFKQLLIAKKPEDNRLYFDWFEWWMS